jgi:hypothetical protein
MPPVLRPLALGELLDHTFQLYRKKFLLFVGIAAIPRLIVFVVQVGLQSAIFTTRPDAFSPTAIITGAVAFVIGMILFVIAFAVSQAATTVGVSEIYMGREISVLSAYGAIKGKLFRVMGLVFGLGFLTVLGFILLIVPGIYLALTWALAIPAAMIENLGVSKAAGRSKVLVTGARGRMFLISLLLFALSYAVLLGLQMPVIALAMFATGGKITLMYQVLTQLSSFIAGSLVAPLGMIAFTLAYYDQRVRKEGFDIQLMMSSQMQASAAVAGNPGTAGD